MIGKKGSLQKTLNNMISNQKNALRKDVRKKPGRRHYPVSSGGSTGVALGYGLLYNWYAANDVRGVAPDGWSVPTDAELTTLRDELGGTSVAGGKLKSTRLVADGDPYWNDPNTGATDEFGFSLFGSGNRNQTTGAYTFFRDVGYLWSSTETNTPFYIFQYNSSQMARTAFSSSPNWGFSIRCLRTTEPPSPTVMDASGNEYTWVQIGSQYWLQQSLKTTKYNNGDDIATGLDNATWAATTDGAWAYPNGDSSLPI